MPLTGIKQTSKTILFERFSVDQIDLVTLLRNEDVKHKDEFLSIIKERGLEVRSFEEFVKNFMPTIWEYTAVTEDTNETKICYSMKNPGEEFDPKPFPLDSNAFYNGIMNLYDKKKASGKTDEEFNYEVIADLLSPKKTLDNYEQSIKDMQYNYIKLQEIGDSSDYEKKKCIKKINKLLDEGKKQYDNFTGQLELAIAKLDNLLEEKDENEKRSGIEQKTQKLLPSVVIIDDNGSINTEVIQQIDNGTALLEDNRKNFTELVPLVEQRFPETIKKSSFMQEIILSNLCGLPSQIREMPLAELDKKRTAFKCLFKQAREDFAKTVMVAVEKFLDVKVFFENACQNGRKLEAPLLVTNCTVAEIVENPRSLENFKWLIKELSTQPGEEHIWFGIIPSVGSPDFIDDDDDEEVVLGAAPIANNNKMKEIGLIDNSDLNTMLDIMKEGKITTFFNYKGNYNTSFETFTSDTLETYRENAEPLIGNPFAVICYPNFTVLPKKATTISIGNAIVGDEKKDVKINIPGIYIDSSYVAAGLFVASQNSDCLQYKGFDIVPNYPNVRFDFEEKSNRYKLATKFNPPAKTNFSSEVEDNIAKDRFGLCFCANPKIIENKTFDNPYIMTARSMFINSDSKKYQPIYAQLTMLFAEMYMRARKEGVGTNNFTNDEVKKFINETIPSWKRTASDSPNASNLLFKENETIELEESAGQGTLKFKFEDVNSEMVIKF